MEENEKQHKNIDAFTLRKSEEILSQIESLFKHYKLKPLRVVSCHVFQLM